MLVFLCLVWGSTWPLLRIALNETTPFTMRVGTAGLGAITLYFICVAMGRDLRVRSLKTWGHLTIASLCNIVGFSLFSVYGQLFAETSRVAIIAYAMPLWAVVLAWIFLGERPGRIQGIALALCVLGLAILVYPLSASGIPLGILFAIATGLSWAAGVVYMKWARMKVDPVGGALWQLAIATVVLTVVMLIAEGKPHLQGLRADGIIAIAITGVLGNGFAYAMWFQVVRRLPAVTASLGVLGSPVVGVVASVILLGERPTVPDMIGFALIFSASACVLFTRTPPPIEATA